MSASGDTVAAPSFSETLVNMLDRVEYRRVDPSVLSDPIFKLRYEAYRREEFIPYNDQEAVRDEFDEQPNAYCFGVYIDGSLVSSIRFHYLTPEYRKSPNYVVFGDILDPHLDRGDTMIDPGRFTVDREASLAHPALPYLTLRIPTLAVLHFGVRYCLSAVRPEHAPFYRRIYGSVLWSDVRHYKGVNFPLVLCASDAPPGYADMLRRYPFFRSTAEERERLFGPIDQSRVQFTMSFPEATTGGT